MSEPTEAEFDLGSLNDEELAEQVHEKDNVHGGKDRADREAFPSQDFPRRRVGGVPINRGGAYASSAIAIRSSRVTLPTSSG